MSVIPIQNGAKGRDLKARLVEVRPTGHADSVPRACPERSEGEHSVPKGMNSPITGIRVASRQNEPRAGFQPVRLARSCHLQLEIPRSRGSLGMTALCLLRPCTLHSAPCTRS